MGNPLFSCHATEMASPLRPDLEPPAASYHPPPSSWAMEAPPPLFPDLMRSPFPEVEQHQPADQALLPVPPAPNPSPVPDEDEDDYDDGYEHRLNNETPSPPTPARYCRRAGLVPHENARVHLRTKDDYRRFSTRKKINFVDSAHPPSPILLRSLRRLALPCRSRTRKVGGGGQGGQVTARGDETRVAATAGARDERGWEGGGDGGHFAEAA
ncbi:hypothetical protein N658DRAFT_525943 [Parathielavia hyrcaniae]|uniref:Uncharacterized protein n=1 Tax=Parathielavia hyrcaniae TaxID=113614 RepID=A0AAN6SZ92_9PEZI|nr:hypothetical protein N658DRAFT_525943 [Parathielavia hyrcaniae]